MIIIAVVIAAILILRKNNDSQKTQANIEKTTQNIENDTKNEEETNTENVETEEENAEENQQEEKKVDPQSETITGTPQTDEQKALSIVAADWGGVGAAFYLNGMDEKGNYLVDVVDSDTRVLARYIVNIKDETFTKREVN